MPDSLFYHLCILGYSIFNLTSDPFELFDLAKESHDGLAEVNGALALQFPGRKAFFTADGGDIISAQHELGYKYPVTGAKRNFWPRIYKFLPRANVTEFLIDSGRVNGDIVGTDFCESPLDEKLLRKMSSENLANTSKNPVLQRLIDLQFPNLRSVKTPL